MQPSSLLLSKSSVSVAKERKHESDQVVLAVMDFSRTEAAWRKWSELLISLHESPTLTLVPEAQKVRKRDNSGIFALSNQDFRHCMVLGLETAEPLTSQSTIQIGCAYRVELIQNYQSSKRNIYQQIRVPRLLLARSLTKHSNLP